jgi:dTDP-3-amino-2,3,6-trideoxy-4-keto-D-glucose/dTDP-3-amino-3,4,6-trideoxy-alpha-D-glucose/dTDP-2,6-dideoxy-D-kanosamine transaminase
MINYYNVAQQYLDCKDDIDQAVQSSMQGGQFFNNGYLDSLAGKISNRYNYANVQLTSSCTAALHAALLCLDLPAGSAIAVPAISYVATAQAVLAAGHHPVFIDVDKHWLMDINDLFWQMDREHRIKAVITVDLYGQGADIYNMFALCRDKGSKLIIDAAQSFGLHSKNYNQVASSDAICLSFNPLKNLGGMGGGAIVSNSLDPVVMRAVCHEGKTNSGPQGQAEYHGLNYRMDAVAAAMLLAKFDYHQRNQQRKYEICARYRSELTGLVEMPELSDSGSVHYTFSIAPTDPERMRNMLSARGIGFSSHYLRPLTCEPVFKRYYRKCEKAELLEDRIISLPCHWHLTDDQVDKVIATVKVGL